MINGYDAMANMEFAVTVAKATNSSLVQIPVGTAEYALAFLKNQIPHVMTPAEVEEVQQLDLVWIEIRKTDSLYPALRHGNVFGATESCIYLDEVTDCPDYLAHYRFWSARPTDEDRQSVPWKEAGND